MNFLAQTVHVWPQKPSEEILIEVHAKAAEMAQQGLTDNLYTIVPHMGIGGGGECLRNWTTIEAADQWVAFIKQYPVSSASALSV